MNTFLHVFPITVTSYVSRYQVNSVELKWASKTSNTKRWKSHPLLALLAHKPKLSKVNCAPTFTSADGTASTHQKRCWWQSPGCEKLLAQQRVSAIFPSAPNAERWILGHPFWNGGVFERHHRWLLLSKKNSLCRSANLCLLPTAFHPAALVLV